MSGATLANRDGFTIVVVEDDDALAQLVGTSLERAGFAHRRVPDAEHGLELVRELDADLVVLDVTLPGMDGVEACRRLRTFSDAYVIMLTGLDTEMDRVAGLSAGADDYLTKPFFVSELVARVRAMRRRPREPAAPPEVRKFGDLTIDPAALEVRVGERLVELSQTEFAILDALSADPSVSPSRRQLLERIWGPDSKDDHVIDVHISNLRRKLGDDPADPRYVRTIRGHGFRIGRG